MLKLFSISKDPSKTETGYDSSKSGKQILLDNLKKRQNFYYGTYHCFKKFCCCCCNCCMKESVEDKLYLKGKAKLHEEIDLLQIIKQLRTSQFVNHVQLKPYQRLLVKWFDKYRIKINQEGSVEPESDSFIETRQHSESLSVNDIQMMNQDHDSSSSSDEGEKDRIEKPKHTLLLDSEKLDKIKDFDPFQDRVDRMILDYVLSEKRSVRQRHNKIQFSLNQENIFDTGDDPNERLL